ncbi:hypothetical protein Q7408_08480 [Glaesserella parasuis]|nr:hypothetical protein [Glaesserella parasuis]MDP0262477.1 hypothetical protein [Glaesserella parasuis]
MAGKTTKFQGTKFYIGTGVEEQKNITACNVKPNATITVASNGFKAGDAITITGLGSLDGTYPIKSVDNGSPGVITLAEEVDWTAQDKPTVFAQAKVARVKWSDNFCAIKNIERSEDTLTEEDVTTMCDEGTVTEPGEIEFGSTKLTFYAKPSTAMQSLLRKKFFAKESFPYKLIFTNNQGTMYGTGFVQSGNNYSGEVKGKFESGATIKHTKRDYHLPVTG